MGPISKDATQIRNFAIAGYIILPVQLLLTAFWVLQGFAGVSIDLLNFGFGYFPSDYFFSVIFLLTSTLLLFLGLSVGWFGKKLNFKSLYWSGIFLSLLNVIFILTTLYQRFVRLPDTPFFLGFYQSIDPAWIFWILELYGVLLAVCLVWISISLIVLGRKRLRKMFVPGIIMLVGVVLSVVANFLYFGALSPLLTYVAMPFLAKRIRKMALETI